MFGWKTEISHGDQVLSPRYFFFQRTITEHNSVLLMRGREQVEFSGRNYPGNFFFGSTVCYFFRSVFVWFSSSRKLHSAGQSINWCLTFGLIIVSLLLNYTCIFSWLHVYHNEFFSSVLFVLYATKQLINFFVCFAYGWLFLLRGWLFYDWSASTVLKKFCPLRRYKTVIAMRPRRIINMRYWPSVRSGWLDIGQVLFLRFYGPRRSRGP